MSSNTKVYEEKMKSSVEHLSRELAAVRAGRANPAVLDKVSVDYYGAPTPIQQVASVAVAEARTLTITPWDRTLLRPISKAIMASDVGITPIDDGSTIRLNFPAPTEEIKPPSCMLWQSKTGTAHYMSMPVFLLFRRAQYSVKDSLRSV